MKNLGKAIVRLALGLLGLIIVLWIVFFFATKGTYPVAKTVAQDSSIPHIKIGNTIFHAETYGSDSLPTLIVIHGGPGNDFRYLLPLTALSDQYHVVFYDQRGTGLSPRVDPKELTLDTMLMDLENIINFYAGDDKINIIGHSWGAMLASGYLQRHPERVNKIVLAEPGLLTTEKAKEFIDKTQFRLNFDALFHIGKATFQAMHIDGPDDQAVDDFKFMNIAMNGDIEGHPLLGYFCNKDGKKMNIPMWRFSAKSSSSIVNNAKDANGNIIVDLVSGVEKYTDKVLFVTGECNTLIGPAFQEGHLKYFPNHEMIIIPDAGHMMFSDQTELSLHTIRKYFDE